MMDSVDTDDLPLPDDDEFGRLMSMLLEHALRHDLYGVIDRLSELRLGLLEEGNRRLMPV